jgi:cytoskeletal protein CcmA (bactofilin family)
MNEEIRKVLEALKNGEITTEEAEALIEAIKQREDYKDENFESSDENVETKVGEITVIEEGEVFEGDINIVNGEAVIKGIVNGDCSIVMGKLTFSGEVKGDMDIVGSRVKWNGGVINGSLNIVASKEEGTPPKVKGGLTRVNNLLLKGLFKVFLKPFLSGFEIKNGNFKKSKKTQKFETLIVEEGKEFKTDDDIVAEEVIVKGKLACGNLKADKIRAIGTISCGNIETEELIVEGTVKTGNVKAENITVYQDGSISSGNVHAENIELNGVISSGNVTCEVIWGNGKLNAGWLNCEENRLNK